VKGDAVRNTRFLSVRGGYETNDVDELLSRVASEIDRGGSPAQTVERASLRTSRGRNRGYDRDSVDIFFTRFLEQLPEQTSPSNHGTPSSAYSTWQAEPAGNWSDGNRPFSDDCAEAWSRFDQLTGTRLRLTRSGLNRQLMGETNQVLATTRPQRFTVGRIGRTAMLGEILYARRPAADPDMATRMRGAHYGMFSAKAHELRLPRGSGSGGRGPGSTWVQRLYFLGGWEPMEWVHGRTGEVTLKQLGSNFDRRADGMIGFSDGEWWRFPVRGRWLDRAIMTAVDRRASALVRYRVRKYPNRFVTAGVPLHLPTIEIVVAPGLTLREDRLLAIALSAPWLRGYFDRPGGGG
jgi:hypothetical protein